MSGITPEAAELARRLIEARASLVPAPRPADLPMSLAVAVRDRCIAALSETSPIAGYKVSLSTGAWGVLTTDMVRGNGAQISRTTLFDPLLECELVFLADHDLRPGSSSDDILDSCRVAPGLEIADSRWEGWRPSDGASFVPPDAELIAADNAMGGALVIGGRWRPARELPLPDVEISTRSEGRVLARGSLGDVMGSPVEAVRWLIDRLAAVGRFVAAGQVVSSGCPCHTFVTVPPSGGSWEAAVPGIGEAQVTFI